MKTIRLPEFLLIFSVMSFCFTSCESTSTIDYTHLPAPVIHLFIQEVASVEFGTDLTIEGTAISETGVRDLSYTLLKKSGSDFIPIGLPRYQQLTALEKEINFSVPVLIDDDEVAAVEIAVTDVTTKVSRTTFIIGSVTGVPQEGAYVSAVIDMAPEYERPVNPSQPALFSSVGINVNGSVKHVLTLSEAKEANSRGIDFSLINMWKNTQTNPPAAASRMGNRGFAFCDISQLGRGPIGRQCDLTWLPVRDTTCMQLVPDNLAKTADFDNLFNTSTDNWKTYKALNKIPVLFPSWTVGTNYYILQKNGASADNTTACTVNYKAGSYIVFRRQNNKDFKYGIIKIVGLADDSDTLAPDGSKILGDDYTKWYTGPDIAGLTYNGVAKLYGRKTQIKVIIQK